MATKPTSRPKQLLSFGFIVLLAGGVLAIGVSQLRSADRALAGRGIQGTFTAESEHCRKSGCTWRGDFLTDAGALRTNVEVAEGSGLDRVGQSVRAADVGDGSTMYPLREQARRDQIATILLSATALVLGVAAFVAVLRRRTMPHEAPSVMQRRRGRAALVLFSALAFELAALAWLTDGMGPWILGAFGLGCLWVAWVSGRNMCRATPVSDS